MVLIQFIVKRRIFALHLINTEISPGINFWKIIFQMEPLKRYEYSLHKGKIILSKAETSFELRKGCLIQE